jgi:hypothetical protein
MLFLVARVFTQLKPAGGASYQAGLQSFAMLLGFFAGAIWAAEKFATQNGGKENKLLWRGVLVWQSALSTFAILGTILSVFARLEPDAFAKVPYLQVPIAICALVAAVGTAALSYARARGEFFDEGNSAVRKSATANLARTNFFNSPKVVFPLLAFCLVMLGIFFGYSGFAVQIPATSQ